MSEYKTVCGESHGEIVEKKSKFIANCIGVMSVNEATDYIELIKSKYYDARHNTYAYCINFPRTVRCSDDGEPQGTAGTQILSVINNYGLKDVVLVVTRYFGGILLGTGGLSKAYRRVAEICIKESKISVKKMCLTVCFKISYSFISSVMNILRSDYANVEKIVYGEDVNITVNIEKKKFDFVKEKINNCLGEKKNMNIIEEGYHILDKRGIIEETVY